MRDSLKVDRAWIGRWYLIGMVASIMGLTIDWAPWMIVGIVALVWAFLSDDDESNHVDPPGMTYMDRDGRPVAGAEKEAL